MDPPAGENRTHLIVILLVLPTDFWTHPIACLCVARRQACLFA
jgi:hypothetical protein